MKRLRLALFAAVAVGMGAAHGASPDLSAFIGTWTFQTPSQVTLVCPQITAPTPIVGTRVSIHQGNTSDLTFEIGCNCTVDFNVDSTGLHGAFSGNKACFLVAQGLEVSGIVHALNLDFSAPASSLTFGFSGDSATLRSSSFSCADSSFAGTGSLVRTSGDTVTCGDPSQAIGVLPTSSAGTADCPLGAGMEGVQISMDDEEMSACSDETGSHGEGKWLLPDDSRPPQPVCGLSAVTVLNFCRVDGSRFKPLTAAEDPAEFYAVLKLNEGDCPNEGITISKKIDNEDFPNLPLTRTTQWLGNIAPSTISNDPQVTTDTTLVFCYYRTAKAADGVMAEFPDLGFPYAVFHRFAGEQPPWVLAKRWQHSNDEDGFHNQYFGDSAYVTEFQDIIGVGNLRIDTDFNLARVR